MTAIHRIALSLAALVLSLSNVLAYAPPLHGLAPLGLGLARLSGHCHLQSPPVA